MVPWMCKHMRDMPFQIIHKCSLIHLSVLIIGGLSDIYQIGHGVYTAYTRVNGDIDHHLSIFGCNSHDCSPVMEY